MGYFFYLIECIALKENRVEVEDLSRTLIRLRIPWRVM